MQIVNSNVERGDDLQRVDGSNDDVYAKVELERVNKQRRRDVFLHDVSTIIHKHVLSRVLHHNKTTQHDTS